MQICAKGRSKVLGFEFKSDIFKKQKLWIYSGLSIPTWHTLHCFICAARLIRMLIPKALIGMPCDAECVVEMGRKQMSSLQNWACDWCGKRNWLIQISNLCRKIILSIQKRQMKQEFDSDFDLCKICLSHCIAILPCPPKILCKQWRLGVSE